MIADRKGSPIITFQPAVARRSGGFFLFKHLGNGHSNHQKHFHSGHCLVYGRCFYQEEVCEAKIEQAGAISASN